MGGGETRFNFVEFEGLARGRGGVEVRVRSKERREGGGGETSQKDLGWGGEGGLGEVKRGGWEEKVSVDHSVRVEVMVRECVGWPGVW